MASGRFLYWVEPPRCHAASKLAPPTSMPRKRGLSDETEAVMILLPWFSRQGPAPGSSNVRPALTTVRVSGPFNRTRRGARSRRSRRPPSEARNARLEDLIREAPQTYDPGAANSDSGLDSGSRLSRVKYALGRDTLAGKPLRYLIGTDTPGDGRDGEIIEVGYTVTRPPPRGLAVKYCNLFDEENSGRYAPYLATSDTAAQYGEGQIDPRGPGWEKNLRAQFARARSQGFRIVELDNPDAYAVADVLGAVALAAGYGLAVIAKNPLLIDGDPTPYVAHPAVVGVIVERHAGNPADMHALRVQAGKPGLPVWFVAFGEPPARSRASSSSTTARSRASSMSEAREWAGNIARACRGGFETRPYSNMRVTWSPGGEYVASEDVTA